MASLASILIKLNICMRGHRNIYHQHTRCALSEKFRKILLHFGMWVREHIDLAVFFTNTRIEFKLIKY
jgi:hypothetical protein